MAILLERVLDFSSQLTDEKYVRHYLEYLYEIQLHNVKLFFRSAII